LLITSTTIIIIIIFIIDHTELLITITLLYVI